MCYKLIEIHTHIILPGSLHQHLIKLLIRLIIVMIDQFPIFVFGNKIFKYTVGAISMMDIIFGI